MPFKVNLTFERRAYVVEKGGASVLVKNVNDMDEIAEKVKNLDFYEYLITEREYTDPEWVWSADIHEVANDDSPDPSPSTDAG